MDFYGEEALHRYEKWILNKKIQVIVPIPLHKKRQRVRGYNQAELFARVIGARLGIPVCADLMIREKNTVPQKELNEAERKNNLKNAFKITKNIVHLSYILLVDDIYTTGSTIDAAALALKKAGGTHIYFICVSSGRPLRIPTTCACAMEVRNCKGCGRLFNYLGGPPLCPACVADLEKKFVEVKEYIRNNPQASVNQVSEDNDVSTKQIKQWIREERLAFTDDSPVGIECENCGAMIKTGRFCDACKSKLQNNLMSAIDKPKKVEPKKPVRDGERMRFLEK